MYKTARFLGQVYIDLKNFFLHTKKWYHHFISIQKKNKSLIDIRPLKFQDNSLILFKNYEALQKKQSGRQLKIFNTDWEKRFMRDLMTISKKMESIVKLLLFTHKSKTEL